MLAYTDDALTWPLLATGRKIESRATIWALLGRWPPAVLGFLLADG